jgi:DNA-binding transcriptional MerR regulator
VTDTTLDVQPSPALLRIQEVAAETGLTPRAIRYYEELGLLAPAARSDGDYRLYDGEDLDRLRFIRGLRDDAGFSLAEIGQLLEDEQARARNRMHFRTTSDPVERRAIVTDALVRIDRQVASIRRKIGRLEAMIAEAEDRRDHLAGHLADIDAGRDPSHGPEAHAPHLKGPPAR